MPTFDLRLGGIAILFSPALTTHIPSVTLHMAASFPIEELVVDWGYGAPGSPQTLPQDAPFPSEIGPITWDYVVNIPGLYRITATAFAGGAALAQDRLDLHNWLSAGGGITRSAGIGDDAVLGSIFDDTLSGGLGDDIIFGHDGHDLLRGGSGANTLDGGANDDTLQGGPDANLLLGGSGNDSLLGGRGADSLQGGGGGDALRGGGEDDLLWGGAGPDMLQGGGGSDTLLGGIPAVDVDGLGGGDTMLGDAGDDSLSGGEGHDSLRGGIGNDTLDGGAHPDRLNGGQGEDVFIGGGENDRLHSQLDGVKDTFVFDLEGDAGVDIISNFEVGTDKIRLPGVAPGVNFELGGIATLAGPTIVFDLPSGGIIVFDPDGNDPGAAFQVARLVGVTTLSLSDFELLG